VDEHDARSEVERELIDRYERHYDVVCVHSWTDAHPRLEELEAAGADVALLLVDQSVSGAPSGDLLAEVHRLNPHARRALLIDWVDWNTKAAGAAIFEGIAQSHFDHYLIRPSGSPDEQFHQTISSMLLDWSESRRIAPHTVHVIGASSSGRAYE